MLGIGNKNKIYDMLNKFFFLFIGLFLLGNTHAQDLTRTSEKQMSRFRPGFMWFNTGFRPASSTESVRKYDRLMLGIHSSQWTGDVLAFKNHWSSLGFHGQWTNELRLFKSKYLRLGFGIGYERVHMRFDAILNRDFVNQSTDYFPVDFQNTAISKSTFNLNQIFIPVELRFRTKGWKHVKFHIGARLGWQFGGKTTVDQKLPDSDLTVQTVTRGFYDLKPFQPSAIFRAGIRNWAIEATYQFNPVFEQSKSAQVNIFTLGLTLSLF